MEEEKNVTPDVQEESVEENKEEQVDVPVEPDFEPETRYEDVYNEEDQSSDEELVAEDREAINKVTNEKIQPLAERLEYMETVSDIDSFIGSKPEYVKYRNSMVKYATHSAYSNIPIHNIAAIVASKDLERLGAEKERNIQKEVSETQGFGKTIREEPGSQNDWSKATKEDIERKRQEVLGQI